MASGRWLRCLAAVMLLASADFGTAARAEDDPGFISLSAGGYDVIGVHSHPAGYGDIEYRFPQKLFFIKPMIGALGTSNGSAYVYFGIVIDLYLSPRWVLTPNGAFGYFHQGRGTDLGSNKEFRTGAEISYRFDDRSRLGLQFHHISNAGISQKNPGEEDAGIVYSIPFNLFK